MTLHCAVSRLGLVNASLPLPVCSPAGCRLLVMGGMLYCFYLGDDNKVLMTSRHVTGAWSLPVDLDIQSFSGLPAVYAYDGKVHVYTSAETDLSDTGSNRSRLLVWRPGEATRVNEMTMDVFGSPAVAELGGKLNMFWRQPKHGELRWGTSTTGEDWYRQGHVHPLGNTLLARSDWDPVICTYQRLLHVFYQGKKSLHQIRFDGDKGWSRGQVLFDHSCHGMPAIFVHDGLLTFAYANLTENEEGHPATTPPSEQTKGEIHDGEVEGTIDLYRYDGNAVSQVDRSVRIVVKGAPAAAVLAGDLYLIFPSI